MTKQRFALLHRSFPLSLSLALGALAACDPDGVAGDPGAGDSVIGEPSAVETPQARAARAHLATAVPQIDATELRVTRERTDALGMTHVRHQQTFHGIPVI